MQLCSAYGVIATTRQALAGGAHLPRTCGRSASDVSGVTPPSLVLGRG